MNQSADLIRYRAADWSDAERLVRFFARHQESIAASAKSPEFLCPFGTRAAIRRKQIFVAIFGADIVGAVRIYPQKTRPIVSVYQFAVEESFEKWEVLRGLLESFGAATFEATCPKEAAVNAFFRAAGWVEESNDSDETVWRYNSPISKSTH